MCESIRDVSGWNLNYLVYITVEWLERSLRNWTVPGYILCSKFGYRD
jgi:hypothetical protein